jgi:O-antigen biosynthesis protein
MLPNEDATSKDGGIDISVVIPSYNHVLYIAQAIDSVVGQTFRNWELIVVDDGSTDGTRVLMDTRYAGHSQIRLIYQNNQGAHHAINTGMALAKGRYISILNSDDVYHPERLQTLLNHCERHPCGLAFTPLAPIDAQGQPLMSLDHPWCLLYARLTQEYKQDGARQALVTGNFAVTTSNFFFRADLLKTLGGFHKQRYNHDWDFMARLVRHGHDIVCVGDKPLLSYRLHGHNTITQNTLMARLELKRILQSLVPADDPYMSRLVSRIQLNMRSIRHEHLARAVQQVRSGYDNHIQNMLADLQAQHAMQIEEFNQANQALTDIGESLLQQIASLELHLAQIQSSRTYRFAQRLSGWAAVARKLLGRAKI